MTGTARRGSDAAGRARAALRWRPLLVSVGLALAASCSAGGEGASGELTDLLSLVPAEDEFVVVFGNLAAHRDAIGVPAPPADASQDQLADHRELLLLPASDRLTAAGTSLGLGDPDLLPLARASAYVSDFTGIEVIRGDFADDAFGEPPPGGDSEPGRLDDGSRLVVEGDTVTIASSRERVEAALATQRGDADSLADVAEAVELVSALDELDVIHGLAMSLDTYAPKR